jgi:hypothetical protein
LECLQVSWHPPDLLCGIEFKVAGLSLRGDLNTNGK